MDLILWSFALQLMVVIWVDFIKTYLFGKHELHRRAAGASRGINKTITSKKSTEKASFHFVQAQRDVAKHEAARAAHSLPTGALRFVVVEEKGEYSITVGIRRRSSTSVR